MLLACRYVKHTGTENVYTYWLSIFCTAGAFAAKRLLFATLLFAVVWLGGCGLTRLPIFGY